MTGVSASPKLPDDLSDQELRELGVKWNDGAVDDMLAIDHLDLARWVVDEDGGINEFDSAGRLVRHIPPPHDSPPRP